MKINKTPLDFNLYGQYEIPQEYAAYIIHFEQVDEQECENLEFEYSTKGYKIFSSELMRRTEGKFDLKLIVAKSEFTF